MRSKPWSVVMDVTIPYEKWRAIEAVLRAAKVCAERPRDYESVRRLSQAMAAYEEFENDD